MDEDCRDARSLRLFKSHRSLARQAFTDTAAGLTRLLLRQAGTAKNSSGYCR